MLAKSLLTKPAFNPIMMASVQNRNFAASEK